jgi:hypothetical protein
MGQGLRSCQYCDPLTGIRAHGLCVVLHDQAGDCNVCSPNERSLVDLGITRTTVRRFPRQGSFRNVRHGGGGPSWIPFGSTWRSAGQRAATMRSNSAASCVSAAMADSEAG